jgi:hypothetical protein
MTNVKQRKEDCSAFLHLLKRVVSCAAISMIKVQTFGDKAVVEVWGGGYQEILAWVESLPGQKVPLSDKILLFDVTTVDKVITFAIESGYVVSFLFFQLCGQIPTGDRMHSWVDDLIFHLLAKKIACDAGEYVREEDDDDEVAEVTYTPSEAEAWLQREGELYCERKGFDPKGTVWHKEFLHYLGDLPKIVERFVVQSAA